MEKFHKKELNLKNIFDNSPVLIGSANTQTGCFTEINSAVTGILGYTAEEFTSIPFLELIHPDDRNKTSIEVRKQQNGSPASNFENRFLCKDGSYKWLKWYGSAADENGNIYAVGTDINEHKLSEQKFISALETNSYAEKAANMGSWGWDLITNNVEWSDNMCRLHGIEPSEYENTLTYSASFQHPDDQNYVSRRIECMISEKKSQPLEYRIITKSKDLKWLEGTNHLLFDEKGEIKKIVGTVQDITKRKKAEEQLKESEEKYFTLIDKMDIGVVLHAHDTSILISNPKASEILGLSSKQMKGKKAIDPSWNFVRKDGSVIPIDEYPVNKTIRDRKPIPEYTLGIKHPDRKHITWIHVNSSLVFDDKNEVKYATIIFSDITEKMRSEQKIVETKLFYESILEGVQDGIWVTDENDSIYYANAAMETIAGVPREKIQGNNVLTDFPEETTGELIGFYKRAKKERKPVWYNIKVHTPAGRDTWQNGWLIPQYQNNTFTGIICSIRDVTKRMQFEKELRESEENLSITLNSIGDAVIATDRKGKIIRMNAVAENLTGWNFTEVKGTLLSGIFQIIHALTRETLESPVEKVLKKGETIELANHTLLISRDGTEKQIADSGSPIRNQEGEIIGVVLVFRDVTDKYKMEEQLRQSQKMDAVGKLAGGIAHDFNNMLAGIMGCADLLARSLGDNSELKEYVDLILDSSTQAAELTQKLLLFSRKGQFVKEVFDIHVAIKKVLLILERSIDKRIEIETNFYADISIINCDQTQIQNAILNFGINSRDAMPSGGKLIITTKNIVFDKTANVSDSFISPGKYIEIDIEDTGIGMSNEVKSHLFEPFFTTKGLGKGTGLGLSVVYNTIKENQGFIDISSEVNKGTVVKVYLPIAENQILKEEKTASRFIQGSGNILVVDDESVIRIIAGEMLRKFGYNVFFAADGEEAIKFYKEMNTNINLVILDIILPKMNGKDVFYELQKINPSVKVLISSGFAQDTNTALLIEDGAVGYIQKPYRIFELSKKVHEVLS